MGKGIYPKECDGCYALSGDRYDFYHCEAGHDKMDKIKLANRIKPPSCKSIVTSYEERRIRQWETYPYLYMVQMPKQDIEAAEKATKTCCDCGSGKIAYKPMWGKQNVWLCVKCAKRYFKRMLDKKNWHSTTVDTPSVRSVGLPRGSGGDKGSGEGAHGVWE